MHSEGNHGLPYDLDEIFVLAQKSDASISLTEISVVVEGSKEQVQVIFGVSLDFYIVRSTLD